MCTEEDTAVVCPVALGSNVPVMLLKPLAEVAGGDSFIIHNEYLRSDTSVA